MKKLKRQYDNEDPSVTQILDVLRKIGLEMWFKFNTIEFINKESSKGKLVGTQTHEAIESHINKEEVKIETEYHEEVMTALKSFMLFKKEHPEVKLFNSEMMLTSDVHKFNGTMDCIGEIDGEQVVFDWKTSQAKDKDKPTIYPEYLSQVSAYVTAYNEVNKTNICKAIIVSIAKDKVAYNYQMLEKEEIENEFNEIFLPCLRILNYKRRNK